MAGGAAGEAAQAEVLRQLRSTFGPAVLETERGSTGLYALLGQVGLLERRCRNPVLVAGTASAGAKLALAQALGKHDTVGLDLVAECVNAVLARGALPLFLVAHLGIGEAESPTALPIVKGIAKGCRQADCALLGTSLEPRGGHLVGSAVGMVERARLLDGPAAARPGDLVLGITAGGLPPAAAQLVRHLLVDAGGLRLDDQPELACPLGEELLRPARIYVRAVRAVLERYRVKGVVHAVAPVADGGLVGSVAGALGRRCVARLERAALPRVPLLDLVRRVTGMADDEMARTFPMGVGMAVVVAPFYAKAAIRRIRRAGERAAVIGEVVAGSGPAVVLA